MLVLSYFHREDILEQPYYGFSKIFPLTFIVNPLGLSFTEA